MTPLSPSPAQIKLMGIDDLESLRKQFILDHSQLIHRTIAFLIAEGADLPKPTGWNSSTLKTIYFGSCPGFQAIVTVSPKEYIPAIKTFSNRVSFTVIDQRSKTQLAYFVYRDTTPDLTHHGNFLIPISNWIDLLEDLVTDFEQCSRAEEETINQNHRTMMVNLLTSGRNITGKEWYS